MLSIAVTWRSLLPVVSRMHLQYHDTLPRVTVAYNVESVRHPSRKAERNWRILQSGEVPLAMYYIDNMEIFSRRLRDARD
ncbi:hypothetical protein M404DRAFT_36777 [Pisolithus tinctorius Marx 270]|uniref:Uncharacterized protein n=1 Tax=Pisolithus tinctorius Marx 270 TaxID=870435 RepID=A0A0C3NAY4_PISTI|nr:hypothetical protein M404DRAFT_36777 [Pisolithus tinctorius Marx 270]